MMAKPADFALLFLLALLWGASYLFIKIAVAEIPPLSLIAIRVSGAAVFLLLILRASSRRLPRDARSWGRLMVQSVLTSTGAWTVLAWGQQFVDAGLASVLNSTSPLFIVLVGTLFGTGLSARKLAGTGLGLLGVVLVVGPGVPGGLGTAMMGQLACLAGAGLYAGAALHVVRLAPLGAAVIATGTMICASAVLVPVALIIEAPWTLTPSTRALAAAGALSILSTGVALVIYFRLVRTLGPLGVASQSYLRAGVGVALGMAFLGERLTTVTALGIAAALLGVALINWPGRDSAPPLAQPGRD